MNEHLRGMIEALETEWKKPEGFLGKVREGHFDPRQGVAFVSMLEQIKLPEEGAIDRRLVALIWYVPQFLRWQNERVSNSGGDKIAFEQFTNRVQGIVEGILGVP